MHMILDHRDTDSSTDDDNASQTTEDDPEIPQPVPPPPLTAVAPPPPPPAPSGPPRPRPRYELAHTLRGHKGPISSVKFSPDGKLLASCGMSALSNVTSSNTSNRLFAW